MINYLQNYAEQTSLSEVTETNNDDLKKLCKLGYFRKFLFF
jgi:hypothetical protein